MDEIATLASKRFLEYYEEAKKIHAASGLGKFHEYKPTEPERLAEVFDTILASPLTGPDFLGYLLHRLVWSQCLGNANHRTSILFLQAFLAEEGIQLPGYSAAPDASAEFARAVTQFSDLSHRRLDRQSEFGYNPKQLEKEHLGLSTSWVNRELGDQSRVAMTIGPQRLRIFLSAGENFG